MWTASCKKNFITGDAELGKKVCCVHTNKRAKGGGSLIYTPAESYAEMSLNCFKFFDVYLHFDDRIIVTSLLPAQNLFFCFMYQYMHVLEYIIQYILLNYGA